MSKKLFIVAAWSLVLPLVMFAASQATGGFGPCSSGMAGFYFFYAFVLTSALCGVLFVLAIAAAFVDRLKA